MKKILVSAILGLAAIASVQAQSAIQLYSYGTPGAGNITYLATAENSSGTGQGVNHASYTVGVYYAIGDVTAAVNGLIGGSTSGQANNNSLVGSGVTLGTGAGSTALIGAAGAFAAGEYGNGTSYVIPGLVGSATVTLVVVAYNGATYETSTTRGHSAAFTMTAVASPAFALQTGNFQPAFGVAQVVPEPSTFALAGLGLASLLIFRRRK